LGQLATSADNVYWFPVRQDLDTFLSKIDSGIIKDVVVLKGPYSARFGPSFSFIDIVTNDTPRYHEGFEWHGRTLFEYKTNGRAVYGRQGLWGGDENWGFRISYGQRAAKDYEDGNGDHIPSGYDSRDIDARIGINLTPNDRLEFSYLRLDQTGLKYPGQIFDTEFLITNGYHLRYTSEHQDLYERLIVDGWYNRTSMAGNAQRDTKRARIPQLNLLGGSSGFQGFTDGDQASSGYRAAVSWGEPKEPQLTVGTDFRYLDGELNEFAQLVSLNLPCDTNFGVPRSHQATLGGIFAEHVLPFAEERFVLKTGGRVDWANMDIDKIPPRSSCATLQNVLFGLDTNEVNPRSFERDYALFMAYATGEYKVNPIWTLTGGFGHAQRPPTQTELYATRPFLAILQNGFTTVVGNPDLATEKLYQIDLGLKANFNDRAHAGVNFFYAWVDDYITVRNEEPVSGIVKLPGEIARTVRFVNTGLATLSGFEFYADAEVTDWLTPFVTTSFVEGRNHDRSSNGDQNLVTRNVFGMPVPVPPQEPLPNIAPLEARIGLRVHEPSKTPRYGVELTARLVAPQNRVAESLGELPSPGFTIYDVRGYWQARKNLLVTAGVENIFNRNYREHLDLRTGLSTTFPTLGVFEPGINAYCGVELTY
jgi:outer membrane receptor protein involved in Fe transport